MKKCFVLICGIIFPLTCRATLIASPAYSDPGDWCFSNCQESGCPRFRGVECTTNCDDAISDIISSSGDYYASSCSQIESDPWMQNCYLGKNGNKHYFCSLGGEDACSEFANTGTFTNTGDGYWTVLNSANHSVFSQSSKMELIDYEYCKMDLDTSYGCASGYYATANTGNANIKCSPCPDGGQSSTGNTNQNGCYLSGNFSDASGIGQYINKCYW